MADKRTRIERLANAIETMDRVLKSRKFRPDQTEAQLREKLRTAKLTYSRMCGDEQHESDPETAKKRDQIEAAWHQRESKWIDRR